MKNHASLRSHARERGGWDGRTGPGLRGRMLDTTTCVLLHAVFLWYRNSEATEESNDILALQMILDAFEENRILLNAYPTHEVLWRYRPLCVLLMLRAAGETVGSATPLKVLHNTQGSREMTNKICTRIGWNIENCTLKSALGEYFKREIEMMCMQKSQINILQLHV